MASRQAGWMIEGLVMNANLTFQRSEGSWKRQIGID
jgi:hypothetical protein